MPDCSLTKRPATIMCDASSPEMVNGLPVKEESEVSATDDCSMGGRERRNGYTLLETKEEEDITVKEECSCEEELLVIVDPLLTFQCKQCKHVFATQCDLDVHMKEKREEGERLHCKKCSETFLKECELMSHAKLHGPGKPFTDKECHSQDELSAKTLRISSSPPRKKYRRILPRIAPPLETQDSESSFGENDHSDSEEENSTGYLDPSQSYLPKQGETNPKQKDGNGTTATTSMKDLSSVSSTVGHPVWCTNTCDTRERPTLGSMKMDCQEEKPERSIPLTESQQECLVALIREKKDVVLCKSQEPKLLSIKKRVWREITEKFNSLNPGQKPRNTAQLKRALDHIKRRVKEEQSKYRRRVLANGVGLPPDPPKFTEAMMAAMEIMGQELSMNDIPVVSVTMSNAEKDDPTPIATTELKTECSSTPAVTTTDAVPSNSTSSSVVPSIFPSLEFSAPPVPPIGPTSSRSNRSSSGHPAQYPNRQSERDLGRKKSLHDCYQNAQESQDAWLQTKKRLLEAEHQKKMKLYEKAERLIDSAQQHIDSLGHSFSLFLAAGQKAYAEMAESYKHMAEKK